MKVLVTGGAGYIGSHVVSQLIKGGHEVIVLDDLSTGNQEAVHEKALFYKGDQKNEKLLNMIFSKNQIEVVMHFSAKLIVSESVEKPIKYFNNNINGLSKILEAMKKHNVKNIVFSSTAAVYGIPKKVPIKENDLTLPINPYGASKLACEQLIKFCKKAHGINYAIFRYFNVAGADWESGIGQSTKGQKITHLVPRVIQVACKQIDKIKIFGDDYKTLDGTCIRDYIHVWDLAKAHILGAQKVIGGVSGTYNLGSSNGYSVKQIINSTQNITGKKINFEISSRRKGDPPILIACTKKANEILGWNKEKGLDEIIDSDYKWRKNIAF